MAETEAPEKIYLGDPAEGYANNFAYKQRSKPSDIEYVRADLAAPDAAAAEIESEQQFYFWLNNHWPDWSKSENHQGTIELMRDAWSAALRLARFDTLAHRGALNYIVELEKSQALTYRMARHIHNTDEVPVTRWGVDGMNLLAELRDLNPEQYDAEVKGSTLVYPDAVRQARRETWNESAAKVCDKLLTAHQKQHAELGIRKLADFARGQLEGIKECAAALRAEGEKGEEDGQD